MAAWFLLDQSPSVDFGSGDQRKSELLLGFVAVLARLISRHGNRVGAVQYGAQGQARVNGVLPARGGRNQVLQLMQLIGTGGTPAELRATSSRGRHEPSGLSMSRGGSAVSQGGAVSDGPTRLSDLLQAATHTVKQRSTVFVVSDFISEPGWEKPLGELARRHDVVAVRLLDPLELNLPDLGLVTVRDAESGEQLLVDTHDSGPLWTRWSSPPTMTWPTPSCVLSICGGAAQVGAEVHVPVCRPIWELLHEPERLAHHVSVAAVPLVAAGATHAGAAVLVVVAPAAQGGGALLQSGHRS
jgi:hypothetical protein